MLCFSSLLSSQSLHWVGMDFLHIPKIIKLLGSEGGCEEKEQGGELKEEVVAKTG